MSKIRTTGERDVYGTGNTKEIVNDTESGISTWWQALIMLAMPIIIGGFFIGLSNIIEWMFS